MQAQSDYWRRTLADAPAVLELPTDRRRPVQQDHAGAFVALELDDKLTAGLKALSRRHGTTLFMTLLAGWAALLGRLAGQDDVVIGTPVANRSRAEVEPLIGFFVNSLALRLDLSGGPTVGELLQRVKGRALEAQQHQDLPFEQVVEIVRPPRNLAHTPVFQVMFAWQNAGESGLELPGLRVAPVRVPCSFAKFDLTLSLAEVGGRIAGGLEYATALFDRATIERHAGYLRRLLEAMVADDARAVDRLPLLGDAERHQLLVEWNATEADYPQDKCVHELFEAQAARTPDAIAVVHEDAQLTYAELNAKANRLAHHLRALGVKPDALVAICVERSLAMVVGLLAVLKAGGAYVPLDPTYPAERLAGMLENSAPAVLLIGAGGKQALAGLIDGLMAKGVPAIDLPQDAALWANQADTNPDGASVGLTPSHLAYVIHTSGSTGQPKGVMVEHRGIVNRLTWMQSVYCLTSQDRVLQKTPFGFDVSVREIFWPLLNGAGLVMARPEGHKDPAYLADIIFQDHVTTLNFVPSMLQAFLENSEAPKCVGLTRVICGGEVLPTLLARRFHNLLPNIRLHNFYGPTETTLNATAFDWNIGSDTPSASIPLGRPISNTRIYILDGHGEPVPIGAAGEIYIGGSGVARGYLNRPELTAERFVADPFAEAPDARMYKTGDLGRYLPDGTIEFLGRNDFQVKIRGFRIEPGEIEARLAQHPAVREAVVLAREDGGDKRLVAYYTVAPDAEAAGAEALRRHLSATLPEYMLPAAYVRLDALPLTANGKLDRKALPTPDGAAYAARGYEAPAGEIEMRVARIWAEVLGLERVGRHDNFFELGGHSLLAVRVIERMRRDGLQGDVRALFATPTLTALAAAVGGGDGIVEVPPNGIPLAFDAITPEMLPLVSLTVAEVDRIVGAVPGGAANIQDIYPLAPLQEGILFHHLMTNEGDPYVLQALFGFDSRLRLERYLDALRAVIVRHDILRTAVLWEGLAEPVQVVWREAPVLVDEVTFDPAAGDIAEQMRARFDPRRFRLDVRQAPLMRLFIAHDPVHDRWVALELHHHLSSDHITLEVVQQEIRAHLLGRAEGLPAPLPFRNFVAQARLGVSREEHEAFFRKMLGDVEEPTAPFGLTDVHGDGSGISEGRRAIDPALAKRLRARARALGVSPASLFHLAWAQVLARTSGRDDVVFGTVLFGRMQGGEGSDRVLGLFLNTLPIRIRIGEDAVADSVRRTHELLTELLCHEHAPLALAQRCSAVAPPAPLFAALLNYRHSAAPGEAVGEALEAGEKIDYLGGEERTNYPFVLSVDDLGDGFVLIAQVRSPLDPDRICAFVHTALEKLASALEHAPATPVRPLDVMPLAERHQVLYGWNATEVDYPQDKCVHELFEAQAARTPDAIAVVHEDAQLTYAELNAKANRLAHRLTTLGVGPDALVAIGLERSIELVLAELAILKCGAAYVPLDQNAPIQRQAFMIEDCQAQIVLSTKGRVVPEMSEVKRVDIDELMLTGQAAHDPAAPVDSEATAYVMYTSGSTGQPKGVMIPHRAVGRLVLNNGYADFQANDRVAFAANPAFDASTMEVWAPLLNGGCIVVIDQAILLDPDVFKHRLEHHAINVLWLTVGLFQQYTDKLAGAFSRLRYLIVGGDVLDPRVAARVLKRSPPQHLLNGYGPTETTTFAVTYEVREVPAGPKSIPIGRPISNTRIYILDGHGEPVPIGAAGEIYIGGSGVARGYLNRPELTAERFVADPFAEAPDARMYKTGDLGRYLPDGTIEFLGRNDFQVKIRGFRIEPGEIEARLAQHPAVREAVALAREDGGDKRLVAYYTMAPDAEAAGAEALRRHLLATLPEYMLPVAYVRLDALPLTANGKLDRKALPTPDGAAYAARGYEAPAGEIEMRVARIWAEVLGLERVGRHDNFFELGGHSLLAVRMISWLRQALGVEMALAELFARPVLAEFAKAVREGARSTLPPIMAARRDEPLPLSFAQQRLWFLAQMEGVSQAYHIPLGLRLTGELDSGALRGALARLVARHEALRTTFDHVDGQPVQRITAEDSGFDLQEHDLRRHSDAEGELQRLAMEEANAAFDLQAGPLIRGRLIRLDDREHVLLITLHHIVSDGWSMGVLSRELGALYRAYSQGQAGPLPGLALQYPDYAIWQRRWLAGEVLQAQSDYWWRTLADAPAVLELPTDRRRPVQQDHAGAFVALELDDKLTAGLKALSRRHGTTLFMTLLAGWAALLGRLAGQDDVVIGTPVANRSRAEVEPLIGFFVNSLALRLDLSGGPTVGELLQRVKGRALEAQQHQDLPFEQVVEIVRPPRNLAHTPVFQVMFAWQNAGESGLELPGLRVAPVRVPCSFAKFDLTLSLAEVGGRIAGGLEYATALFDRATIERHAGYLRRLLEAMVADDERAVDRLPLLGDAERHQLLVEWNATEVDYPQDKCVHELFEAQAARTPDAIAVVHEDTQLTYAELNAKANRLAHRLTTLGVGPDALVAIGLERSIELVLAELAILKCGAAYVPLDQNAPIQRQAFMIEDCQAQIVLSAKGRVVPEMSEVKRVDIDELMLTGQAAHDPAAPVDSEATAYVMYTSGSTGQPKGVMIPHRAVGRLVLNNGYADFQANDRVAFAANPAFDASTMEVWAPLLNGGCIVVIDQAILLDPDVFKHRLEHHAINVLWLTVGLFQQYTDKLAGAFSRLRYLIVGGDVLDPRVAARVLKRSPPQHLLNGYGPTETTTFAVTYEVREVPAGPKSIPIGRPISNTRIYILDGHGEPVPIGAAGEIYIGGSGVARGYLNRPELTAERFVADPFAEAPDARMYKTGDLGRYLPDGTIEFLGRNDFQVKIRGFRIEPGEIEARLAQHPAVREAVALAREDGGDKRLVAYYTMAPDAEAAGAEALRRHLLATLPEYMLPVAYVRLDALPLTANGKLDRKALPTPDGAAYAARGYEAPAGEIEMRVARIWAEVLGLERVGRHDNFFELGGHSLAALRLVAQVASTFDVEVGVAALFVAPTIGEFAARVSKAETPLEPWTIIQIQPLGEKTPIIAINDTMRYYKLAHRIGTDRGFLGVQLFDPSNPCPLPNRNLEEIASDYVRLIRKAQPHGPYILFGLCVSGLIAYEAARQLRQVGEPVSLVVMADTWCPGDLERFPLGRRVLLQLYYMLCFRLNYYRHRLNSYRHTLTLLRHGKKKISELRIVRQSKIPNLLSALHLIESPSKPVDEQWMNRWVLQALEYARAIYQPPASAGDVVLLQSEQLPVGRFIDPKMGWSDFVTGQLLLYRIPGWHELMFNDEGAVALIAEHLRPLLNQVDAARNCQR